MEYQNERSSSHFETIQLKIDQNVIFELFLFDRSNLNLINLQPNIKRYEKNFTKEAY